MHVIQAETVRSKATNRGRPGVAILARQKRIWNPLPRLLAGLIEHIDSFPRKFHRPIRICRIGKTNEILRVVPAVVPAACAGATGVLPLGLGG